VRGRPAECGPLDAVPSACGIDSAGGQSFGLS
jgi:hypothetical protein